jgi:hypothetical protein
VRLDVDDVVETRRARTARAPNGRGPPGRGDLLRALRARRQGRHQPHRAADPARSRDAARQVRRATAEHGQHAVRTTQKYIRVTDQRRGQAIARLERRKHPLDYPLEHAA